MNVATILTDTAGTTKSLAFVCPGCGIIHSAYVEVAPERSGKISPWEWNGSLEAPTLRPSLKVEWSKPGEKPLSRVCHSYVKDGYIEFLGDCTHELAGKTIPMPEHV